MASSIFTITYNLAMLQVYKIKLLKVMALSILRRIAGYISNSKQIIPTENSWSYALGG